jgi:hypothetical protein
VIYDSTVKPLPPDRLTRAFVRILVALPALLLAAAWLVDRLDRDHPGLRARFVIGSIVGVAAAACGLLWHLQRRRFAGAVLTTAVIVGVERRTQADGGVSWHPSLRFTLASGQVVTVATPAGAFPLGLRAGREVRIRYLPDDYQIVEIRSRWPLVFVLSVLALFLLAGGMMWRHPTAGRVFIAPFPGRLPNPAAGGTGEPNREERR